MTRLLTASEAKRRMRSARTSSVSGLKTILLARSFGPRTNSFSATRLSKTDRGNGTVSLPAIVDYRLPAGGGGSGGAEPSDSHATQYEAEP